MSDVIETSLDCLAVGAHPDDARLGLHAVLLELALEGEAGDAEEVGGARLVAFGLGVSRGLAFLGLDFVEGCDQALKGFFRLGLLDGGAVARGEADETAAAVGGIEGDAEAIVDLGAADEKKPAALAENTTQLEETSDEKGKRKAKDEKEAAANAPLAIAGGGRYDYLAKRLGSKKDIPAVGGSIGVDRVLLSPNYKATTPRIVKKPKIYFIQLGFEAKLKSLEIIEVLRAARIPVSHSLNRDSLSGQLGTAEKLGIPYAIIFGQKEALEGTVIVRNMATRSQDTVKVAKLAEYIKNIK